MYRFFQSDDFNLLSKEDEHHLVDVIRIKINEYFEIVDVNKVVSIYQVNKIKPLMYTKIRSYNDDRELKCDVTLVFGIAKGDKNDFVVQKATELGASRIVFVPTKRSVAVIDKNKSLNKLNRFISIAKEASMQSHRTKIPEIIILDSFKKIIDVSSELNFVAYEGEECSTLKNFETISDKKSLTIFVGSEGGISEEEISFLKENNYSCISLGKRILRCETAVTYALSVISYVIER